jgi:hypothetical protein
MIHWTGRKIRYRETSLRTIAVVEIKDKGLTLGIVLGNEKKKRSEYQAYFQHRLSRNN